MTQIDNGVSATRRLILKGAGVLALAGLGVLSFDLPAALAAANDKYPEDAFKQKTAYEILRGDWSSDVCSSDLLSVKIRFRPNGGITVSGLRLVSSVTMATRSSRLGYLLLRSTSSGPIEPGRSPPLMAWQVRQLPLPRSKASFWPSAAADCA